MNPGLLKLELIAHGVRAGSGCPEPLANPFGLVQLALPEKVEVSVHLVKGRETPFHLTCEGNRFFLEIPREKEPVPVGWIPPLRAYGERTSAGVLVSDILTVHGGLIAVHPKGPCRFGTSGLSCRYCGSTKELSSHPPFSKQDLIEALEIVLSEKRCDFVNFSSGRVTTEDGGVEWLRPWVSEIRRQVDVLISLDLAPPKTNTWIDETYVMGVDAVYYDLDFFNPSEARSRQEFEEKNRRHLEALEYAATIFPTGTVFSHLVIGFEPLEETKKMIDLLIDRGVVPLLVYFPPYPESNLARDWHVTPEETTSLFAHLFERIIETKNTPHWVQQTDVVLTPLEGHHFSNQSARYHLALKKFYDTSLGRMIRMGLISLRRHLRVRDQAQPME